MGFVGSHRDTHRFCLTQLPIPTGLYYRILPQLQSRRLDLLETGDGLVFALRLFQKVDVFEGHPRTEFFPRIRDTLIERRFAVLKVVVIKNITKGDSENGECIIKLLPIT